MRSALEADHPLAGAGRRGEVHLFEMLETADHQAADFGIAGARIVRAQVDIADLIGCDADFHVQPRPPLGGHFLLKRGADFVLGLRAKLDPGQLLGARAQAMADIVARDDEIGALVVDAAHEEMDVRVGGVPVVHGHPVELRAEVHLHLLGKIAGERLEVGHVGGVLGRDDEPEVMSVVLAAIGEGAVVGAIGLGVEHHAALAVTADAIALEVGTCARTAARRGRRGPGGGRCGP